MEVLPKIKVDKRIITTAVVVLLMAGVGGYFGYQYLHQQWLEKNPEAKAREETEALMKKVGSHVLLPSGEMPTVATVSDVEKLASQPFFAMAKTGDKVLIFNTASRAFLYRPEMNRVIEITSMNPPQPTEVPQIMEGSLAIWNGTQTSGLAALAETQITKDLKNLKVASKGNSEGDYQKSVVIVLNARAGELGKQLGELVKATVTDKLPEGEQKPEADLLLILGEDFKN